MKDDQLLSHLLYLKLAYFREHHQALAKEAVEKSQTHLDFLSRLVEGEALRRKDRATQRRIQAARFPAVKTREQSNRSGAPSRSTFAPSECLVSRQRSAAKRPCLTQLRLRLFVIRP